MKECVAKFLVKIVNKLCPTYELKPSYEAKDVAVAVAITKMDILQYRNSCDKKISYGKALSDMVRIQRGNNHSRIFEALEKNALIIDRVYQKDGDKVVETRLKVYVRKEK